MASRPGHVRYAVAVALCVAAIDASADRAPVVVAIADDVHAVVIRDASMRQVTYTIGETVKGTQWRLVEVRRGEAILRNARAYKGAPFEVRLRVGQKVDPATADEGNASPKTEANVEGS